jgi:homoserine O-acetyltransferase
MSKSLLTNIQQRIFLPFRDLGRGFSSNNHHHKHAARTTESKSKATHASPLLKKVTIHKPFPLVLGGQLPQLDLTYTVSNPLGCKSNCNDDIPTVYIMPSMSHSAHVFRPDKHDESIDKGWWEHVVGYGSEYAIDANRFRIISASPIGGPFGSSSPISVNPETNAIFGSSFPQITPADQALAHKWLLDHLGISQVKSIVGASMGGMQALMFSRMFPALFDRCIAMCCTGWTSPSTVALRSVQRDIVMMDPNFMNGNYRPGKGPLQGLGVARKVGTIAYRSRDEFDSRFEWKADKENRWEVERYLSHQAVSFQDRYDANCYLLLSKCMDLMDIGRGFDSFELGVKAIGACSNPGTSEAGGVARVADPNKKEIMLIAVKQDALIPASEMEHIAYLLGQGGIKVHYEALSSIFGHDAFLIKSESQQFVPRIKAFLEAEDNAVNHVRAYLSSIS